MKIRIEIDQIDNGYTVSFFSNIGSSDLDKTIFCMNWADIEDIIKKWCLEVTKIEENKEE